MDVESAFEALSHSVRRDIAWMLAESGELSSGEIADHISAVGRTTVSTHLRVLRQAGIVRERQDGRHRYYSVDQQGIAQEVLAFVQGILSASISDIPARKESDDGVARDREAG